MLAALCGADAEFLVVLTAIDGVESEAAWRNRIRVSLAGLEVPVLGREDMVVDKRAAGRPEDLANLAWLEALDPPDRSD